MSFDPYGYDPNKPTNENVQPTPSEPQPTGSVHPVDGTAPIPYQGQMQQPTNDGVRHRVQLPAIFLIVLGVLNLLWVTFLGVVALGYGSITQERWDAMVNSLPPEQRAHYQKMEADIKKGGYTIPGISQGVSTFALITGGTALVASLFILLGGILMLQMRGYGFCIFASLLTAVPFVSGSACCCLGEGIGIWALVVLLSNDVRMAFK
jgi:hypothetical protein